MRNRNPENRNSHKPQSSTAVEGIYEPDARGGGRLRLLQRNCQPAPDDPVVGSDLVTRLSLRGGEMINVVVGNHAHRAGGRPVVEVNSVDGVAPNAREVLKPFEELTAINPSGRIRLEVEGGPLSMRVVDLLAPIGFGQRALIVAAPRTGKTVLLQQMAAAIATNHPDVHMLVLLIDERPEEVTEMRRTVHGEVMASSNDHDVASHIRLARLMMANAKRRVEAGQNVVVLLDSLTRVGRAFNAHLRGSSRIMSGGLDIRALTEPKAIFGSARNIENGGSLTVIASALIETGSRMDEVIFNEFKGTGNMEIMLSRQLANLRIWPAIDLHQSGTRKEELLLSPEELQRSHMIRRAFLDRPPEMAMTALLEQMQRFADNRTFVKNAR